MTTAPEPTVRTAAIAAWGSALPDRIITNAELVGRLDTTDDWIVERTGIRERRMGGTTSELAAKAARQALDHGGYAAEHIDLLVLATSTPDAIMPATAVTVAAALGLHCGTFDLNGACSGFVYALAAANGLVVSGLDRVLVIGADVITSIVDHNDRSTAVLFGDGAGAVVLEASAGPAGMLGFDAGTDGTSRSLLFAESGSKLMMDGKEVFRRAVRATVDSANSALERAKVSASEIALFVPHQANLRIIQAACERLGIPEERASLMVERTGNTSAASIPLALAEVADAGGLHDGDLVLFSGFGAGMSWASAVWRWGR